jgi:hypothetical protein
MLKLLSGIKQFLERIFGDRKTESHIIKKKKNLKKHQKMYVVVFPNDSTIEFWSRKNALACGKRYSDYKDMVVYEVNPDNYDLDIADSPHNGQFGIYRYWSFPARKRHRR